MRMMTNMVQEYVVETRWQRNRRIRRMWPESMPVDKTWQEVLLAAAFALVCAVLTVRWFLCV